MVDEQKIVNLGREKYWSVVRSSKEAGKVSNTPSGSFMMREATSELRVALEEWLEAAESKPGRRHTAAKLFRKVPTDVAALIISRACIDAIALRKPFMSIAMHIGNLLEDEYRFLSLKKQERNAWNGAMRTTFHTSSYADKRKILRSAAAHNNIDIEIWTSKEKAHLGSVALELIRKHTGMIEVENVKIGKKTTTEVFPSEGFLQWLEKSEEFNQDSRPFLMPLSEEPLPWVSLHSGGYHHPNLSGKCLVKTRSEDHKLLLEKADMSQVYRAVNALQDTGYEINERVFAVFEYLYQDGRAIAGLPQRELLPEPKPPHDVETNERAKRAWFTMLYRTKNHNIALSAKRLSVSNMIRVAKECQGAPFFYPYQCDFRGRMYAQGFFLNPMAGDLSRGMLQFSKAKAIGSHESARWLQIHGANCFGNGLNLKSIEDRCAWVQENTQRIRAIADDPLADLWWTGADECWQFLAFAIDYSGYIAKGLKYESKLCVAMDGRNNGLQNYALLLRDEDLAAKTGCMPSNDPPDIYTVVADMVTEELTELACSGHPVAARVLTLVDGKVSRDLCKLPVMTLPYGSTIKAVQDYLIEIYFTEWLHKGDGTSLTAFSDCGLLASIIWKAIQRPEVAKSALDAMGYLRALARSVAHERNQMSWTAPSGFVVKHNYRDQKTLVIKTTLGSTVRKHNMREEIPDTIDKSKSVTAFPANFIHSLDASSLVGTINHCLDRGGDWSFWCVHDSYGTHAADAPELAASLAAAHIATFTPDLLQKLLDEALDHMTPGAILPTRPSLGGFDIHQIADSRYFFT